MRSLRLVSMLACLALPGAAQAVKMMYACTGADGRTSIQDRPCSGEQSEQSYATPDGRGATSASPGPRPRSAPPKAHPRNVDFSIACKSLSEDRFEVIENIRGSREERLTARLQRQLVRIHLAQCTAHCEPC